MYICGERNYSVAVTAVSVLSTSSDQVNKINSNSSIVAPFTGRALYVAYLKKLHVYICVYMCIYVYICVYICIYVLYMYIYTMPHSEALTVAQCKAHCSQFEHFGDSIRTPVAPLMSPSPVCLSAEGAKNVSGP